MLCTVVTNLNSYHLVGRAKWLLAGYRRTEELIGNMYSQYMATAPPLSLGNDTPKLNGISKRTNANPSRTLIQQDSTDTNTSEDIKPCLPKADTEIFTVENQMAKIEGETSKNSITNIEKPNTMRSFPDSDSSLQTESLPHESMEAVRNDLPSILRPKRNILEPIRREEVPSWSLAKGPCVVAMQKKNGNEDASPPANSSLPPINGHIIKGNLPVTNGALQLPNGKKVPPVKNGLQSNSGEISTIMEGHVQSYKNSVSKATIDLFSVSSNKG